MKNSLIGLMRQTSLVMKGTALITVVSFAMLVTSPAAMALRTATDNHHAKSGDSNPEARLSALLEQITYKFDALEAAHAAGQDTDAIVSELDQLQDQMIALDNDVMANFEATEQKLKDKNLPETILKRHQDMVTHYQAHRARIIEQFEYKDMSHWRWLLRHWWDRLLAWLGVEIGEIVDSPIRNVNPRQFKRSHQAFDPNNLPNKSMRPDKDNKPKQSLQDYHQAKLFNTPANQVAELGDFMYDALAGASDPAYLTETDEVILTQRIKDQAQALSYDPVRIYHWVRNNVEWQPSWGAVQDAELTLDARRGNAMDIASLTIALLRASQIPARYVHGTIEVPEAMFRNWAGGFASIDAAVDFAASGGIPTAASIAGGKIAHVQLEHVWVEAAIDYFPSRGASNHDADAWVQMDPSYKRYQYLQGLDAVAISGIDTNQLATDFLASGTINETEGWIQGFDPTILENAQSQALSALEDYITTNMTNPTVGDVIGGRKTIILEYPALPSSLPNRILVEGARYDKLPLQLQQRITYSIGRDDLGLPINPTTFAYATLNNEKVTLSFRPATPDDEAALLALLPEGEVTDISQLP
ncbi:MAG: transglutaminase domain-containing protein, partial [Gammaproteobacteria bacterium]|nr:transglutaminase domain-containing protein [Gammaproteobacteria bacterium]